MQNEEIKETKSRLKNVEKAIVSFEHSMGERRNSAARRFPILFLLLSTFGLVCTLYGLEKIIDNTPYLNENPFVLFGLGITLLIITGALYKKL